MKYLIMIHSNPRPWGHPTSDHLPEYQEVPAEEKARMNAGFDTMLGELHASGELVGGHALGDPAASRLLRWDDGPVVSDGPYSETKEHFAGFFEIDVADRARAEEVARSFVGPGETVELRAVWEG